MDKILYVGQFVKHKDYNNIYKIIKIINKHSDVYEISSVYKRDSNFHSSVLVFGVDLEIIDNSTAKLLYGI